MTPEMCGTRTSIPPWRYMVEALWSTGLTNIPLVANEKNLTVPYFLDLTALMEASHSIYKV